MKNELIIFLKWIINNNFIFKSLNLALLKIKHKLIRANNHDRYKDNIYPEYLSNIINLRNDHLDFNIKSEKIEYIQSTYPEYINLASIKFKIINGSIKWNQEFSDTEEYESLHRWNWLLSYFSKKNYDEKELNWAFLQIENWVDEYHIDFFIDNKDIYEKLEWESYNISERISNTFIINQLFNFPLSYKIKKSLYAQTLILINRLEYFQKFPSNHVFNNARSLYFSSLLFENEYFHSISISIIKNELKNLITVDGFLREGSSHYQFLFTRWFLEIYIFAIHFNDQKMLKTMKPNINKLINACSFFLVKNENNNSIPFFGDISPDFKPSWLIDILDSSIFNKRIKTTEYSSWNNLFRDKVNFFENNPDPENKYNNEFPLSGWFKYQNKKAKLFMRSNKEEPIPWPGHFHEDFGHFCLYVNNLPLIIDPGRTNYNNEDFCTSEYHNTVTVNDVSMKSKIQLFKEYNSFSNFITSNQDNENIIIQYKTDAFKRMGNNFSFIRRFNLGYNDLKIKDIFYFNEKKSYKIKRFFHFQEGIYLSIENEYIIIKSNDFSCQIFFSDFKKRKIKIIKGEENILGCQNIQYGIKVNSSTLLVEDLIKEPIELETKILWN